MLSEIKYAVVCVDDDPHILQMLSFQLDKIIKGKSTLIEYFTNPEEAIEGVSKLSGEEIDIIFLIVDYRMPNMTGAEFIRKVKEVHPELKCIMLSGQASAIHVDELVNDNLLESFISKPWEEEDLLNIIQPILEKKYKPEN
jgi:YesN/AraC family two-component response regulator